MERKQIRIERKTPASKNSAQSRRAAAQVDLRTPSGKKLPY